jgi:hypothetical protein
VSVNFESDVTANGLRHLLAGMAISLASMMAVAAPTAAAKQAGRAVVCTAQGTSAGLEVHCPTATVAELLAALQQATGLRSEYPQELGRARVSVTLKRGSLLEVLERALPAFNFAVWTDDKGSPSVTWLRIVEMRRTVERAEQAPAFQEPEMRRTVERAERAPAVQEAAMPPPEVAPASAVAPPSTAALHPTSNKGEMARVRESFARSVTLGSSPLEAPPVSTASMMPPVSTSPVLMPGVEMPR